MINVNSKDDSVFIGVVRLKSESRPQGWTKYVGLFATKGAARAAVNREVKRRENGSATVTGTAVWRGTVGWEESV